MCKPPQALVPCWMHSLILGQTHAFNGPQIARYCDAMAAIPHIGWYLFREVSTSPEWSNKPPPPWYLVAHRPHFETYYAIIVWYLPWKQAPNSLAILVSLLGLWDWGLSACDRQICCFWRFQFYVLAESEKREANLPEIPRIVKRELCEKGASASSPPSFWHYLMSWRSQKKEKQTSRKFPG